MAYNVQLHSSTTNWKFQHCSQFALGVWMEFQSSETFVFFILCKFDCQAPEIHLTKNIRLIKNHMRTGVTDQATHWQHNVTEASTWVNPALMWGIFWPERIWSGDIAPNTLATQCHRGLHMGKSGPDVGHILA